MGKNKKKNNNNNNKKKKSEKGKFVYKNITPPGEYKKDLEKPMLSGYHPTYVEAAWYDWWDKKGFFKPQNNSKKERYVIVLPPPNVTGKLHVGHGLTVAIQDALIRYYRMSGHNTLYLPGTDHAGIATQVVVEKRLMKTQKKSRHDIGRDNFIKEVFKWKDEYGNTIYKQLRRTGASLDWTRKCFTMDKKLSNAVNEAFVRMYEKKYIYRATRLVNWDCTLRTAISNIEVEHIDIKKRTYMSVGGSTKKYEFGVLTSFAYKLADSDDEIVVATTRPETMLGDTAVCVHPDDERYKKFHGKFVVHPFNGRKIPIITDSILVDPKFGTGAVKITPAHDHNDFECGKRHKLKFINILNDDGTLNKNGFPFEGKNRLDVRELVVKGLVEKKLYRGKKNHVYSIAICSRSKDVIEPVIKPQWYCNCKDLAKRSIDAVDKGDLKITPVFHVSVWKKWLGDIREWCISRQLWWGHRIPAYLVHIKGEEKPNDLDEHNWVVARNKEEALKIAMKRFKKKEEEIKLVQDDDVLDTWFSSGLFPFSTMGWPNEKSVDLKDFFPNSILETGADIIFFWVARMVMMSFALMDCLPFKEVYLHAMVRDKFGRKMSKSLGNVVDPIDVIESISLSDLHKKLENGNLPESEIEKAKDGQKKSFPNGIPECGTDALRFSLLNYTSAAVRDISLDVDRVHGYRNFCNKIWNTVAFASIHLDKKLQVPDILPGSKDSNIKLSFSDKWILSRLNYTIKTAQHGFKTYNFNIYTAAVYDFWMKEFCSSYLEMIKGALYKKDEDSTDEEKKAAYAHKLVLYTCIEQCLRLLHPAMPFVTEELWQRLPRKKSDKESIMISSYPVPIKEWTNSKVEEDMLIIREIIKKIRFTKASYNLSNAIKPPVFIDCSDKKYFDLISGEKDDIKTQAFSGEIKVLFEGKGETIPTGCAIEVIDKNCSVHTVLKGYINFESEVKKQTKKVDKLTKILANLQKRMNSKSYSKVPKHVQDRDKQKESKYKSDIENIKQVIENLKKLK